MDEYIKRSDVIKARHACDRDCKSCDFAQDGDSWCMGELFVVDVINVPAADVRPNTTGEWFLVSVGRGHVRWGCTACQALSEADYEYCPHCGAKMKEWKP